MADMKSGGTGFLTLYKLSWHIYMLVQYTIHSQFCGVQ